MPGALPGTASMGMNGVNTMTVLELAVQQQVGVAVDGTDGLRGIDDVHGEGSQHGELEMSVKQPHG